MPDEEQELSELDVISGVAVTVAVIGARLGLLLYLIRRKQFQNIVGQFWSSRKLNLVYLDKKME